MNSVKTNKRIFKIVSLSGSHTILVFLYQTAWQWSDGNPPNGGVECRWGKQKSQFWAYNWLHCMLSTLQTASCYQHNAAGPRSCKLWHLSLVASSGVCWWQETTTNCLWQEVSTLRWRQQNSAFNCNTRLCSTFCTIEANYWQTRSIVGPLCDSRTTCFINCKTTLKLSPLHN